MSTLMDVDGLTAIRVSFPETDDEDSMLTLFTPETEHEAATSFTVVGMSAVLAIKLAIEHELEQLERRMELLEDDVPQ